MVIVLSILELLRNRLALSPESKSRTAENAYVDFKTEKVS